MALTALPRGRKPGSDYRAQPLEELIRLIELLFLAWQQVRREGFIGARAQVAVAGQMELGPLPMMRKGPID